MKFLCSHETDDRYHRAELGISSFIVQRGSLSFKILLVWIPHTRQHLFICWILLENVTPTEMFHIGDQEKIKKKKYRGYLSRQVVFRLAIDVSLLKSQAGMRQTMVFDEKLQFLMKTTVFWWKPQSLGRFKVRNCKNHISNSAFKRTTSNTNPWDFSVKWKTMCLRR